MVSIRSETRGLLPSSLLLLRAAEESEQGAWGHRGEVEKQEMGQPVPLM